jgi:hypothetical protein
VKLALKWFVPITLVAMGLAWVSEQIVVLLGFDLPSPQPLVQLFTDPNVPWPRKMKYAAFAVVAAPIVEEIIFRMGMFNLFVWLGRRYIASAATRTGFPLVAALLSGVVFAVVHLHAATFVPLWFLGVAFAWLYWKGGTIRASMLAHFLFNLINLSLCLFIGAGEM